MNRRRINWYSISAIALTGAGVSLTALGFVNTDPYQELFGISVIVSGAVSALLGLH